MDVCLCVDNHKYLYLERVVGEASFGRITIAIVKKDVVPYIIILIDVLLLHSDILCFLCFLPSGFYVAAVGEGDRPQTMLFLSRVLSDSRDHCAVPCSSK